MPRAYTRTGDKGETGLLDGRRVSKDHARIEAMGDVDELNAAVGVALESCRDRKVRALLRTVQDHLFIVGAEVAASGKAARRAPRIRHDHVAFLEKAMEEYDPGPIKEFILPRGSPAIAAMHVARTVARRAERRCVALSREENVNPELLRYLNRLSSFLYTVAVWLLNRSRKRPEHPSYR